MDVRASRNAKVSVKLSTLGGICLLFLHQKYACKEEKAPGDLPVYCFVADTIAEIPFV